MTAFKANFLPKIRIEYQALNSRVNTNPRLLISESEQHYRNEVNDACDKIIASGSSIVLLSGPSASGKTTTAINLVKRFNQLGVGGVVVSLDDFFKNIEDYPVTETGDKDYESIFALDLQSLNRCLSELINNKSSVFPTFDFEKQRRSEKTRTVDISNGEIVVIEGIHALNPILVERLPENDIIKVYVGLRKEYNLANGEMLKTLDIRIIRRIIRDYNFRGYSAERTIDAWAGIIKGEGKWIKPYKENANILIDSTFDYEPCVYLAKIKQLLDIGNAGMQAETLEYLCHKLSYFNSVSAEYIPDDSMLREFIG